MKNYRIVSYDSKHKPQFNDLTSNNNLFNKKYPESELNNLGKYKDNSDYSNYPTFEEVVANFNPETDSGKSFICRVKDHQIWTSDSTLGGYDRASQVDYTKCLTNLQQAIYGSDEPKGFVDEDAGVLNGYVRYIPDKYIKDLYNLYLTKNMGNHRFVMKKLANKGNSVDYLMKVFFHNFKDNLTQKDFITIESDGHHSDAGDRKSQKETQKFHSGFRAKRKEAVECFNFLRKSELNYEGIMELEKIDTNINVYLNGKKVSRKWPALSSIMDLNKGEGNGYFKKYGDVNVSAAVGVARKIATTITGEEEILNSAIKGFASMFKSLTEWHGTDAREPLFDRLDLSNFFIEFFKENNKTSMFRRKKLTLADMTVSGGIKDINYICAEIFWRDGAIIEYYRQMTTKHNGKKRTNGFTNTHPCMTHFLGQITPLIRKEAVRLVTM